MVEQIEYQNVHLDEFIILVGNLPLPGPTLPSPIHLSMSITSPAYFKSPKSKFSLKIMRLFLMQLLQVVISNHNLSMIQSFG